MIKLILDKPINIYSQSSSSRRSGVTEDKTDYYVKTDYEIINEEKVEVFLKNEDDMISSGFVKLSDIESQINFEKENKEVTVSPIEETLKNKEKKEERKFHYPVIIKHNIRYYTDKVIIPEYMKNSPLFYEIVEDQFVRVGNTLKELKSNPHLLRINEVVF